MNVNQPDLSIVIVNWKSAAFTRKCLATIYANTEGLNFEVLVIDNASYDGWHGGSPRAFPATRT